MLALSEVSARTLAAAQQPGAFLTQAGAVVGPAAAAAGAGSAAGVVVAVPHGGLGGGSGGAGGSTLRLPALNRMVEVLLFNLPHIQVCVRGGLFAAQD
jgi:hypothetical protein